jgi:hypothetical protein
MNINETSTFAADISLEEFGSTIENTSASISIKQTLDCMKEMDAAVRAFTFDLEKYMNQCLEDAYEGFFQEGNYYFLQVNGYPDYKFTFRFMNGKFIFSGDYSYIRQILIMKNLGMLTNGIF